MRFDGKVVLITGASSGIGADVARFMAKLGAKVSIVGRNEQRLNAVAEQIIKSNSPTPLPIVADVTKDTERIVNETIKHFRKLDILINNAGVAIKDNIVNVKMSEFDRIFDTNVRSVIQLTKLCVPHLEKTNGNVVNVSSTGGLKSFRNLLSYCISKAALDQFTKCSALDLASKKIRVNSINPAIIRTPIFETIGASTERIKRDIAKLKSIYPVGRIGEVSDTSAAIAYLADDNLASFINGSLFVVDGGSMLGSKL